MDLRYRLQVDLAESLETITETEAKFGEIFGRSWGGVLWTYRMHDADHVLVSMGSLASECTLAADSMRSQGIRAGVLGVRAYRPFPAKDLTSALSGIATVSVFEKDISYGYGGALAMDLKAELFDADLRPRFFSFVAGLGGRDVSPAQIARTATDAIFKGPSCAWIDVRG
jgi:pyruvate/2-oxoacid:ferredoxin oxidoreductase alpha subunit